MNPLWKIDLVALTVGWGCCWFVVRHSLPAQNVLTIGGLAIGLSALAHGLAQLLSAQAAPAAWYSPVALGLIAVVSRALARRLDLSFAYSRVWVAFVLTIPALLSLEASLTGRNSHKSLFLMWGLAIGLCQVVVTPWWIRKRPGPEEGDSKAGLLWLAISCYLGVRAYGSGAPVSGLVTISCGVLAGVLAMRNRARN